MPSGNTKISIKSKSKLWIEVLENINIFPFKNLVVKLTLVSFLIAKDFTLLTYSSSKSIKLFILLFLYASSCLSK